MMFNELYLGKDMDVNEEYLKIFGVENRPTLYAADDAEYKALRQQIMSATREYNPQKKLPFEDVKLCSYQEFKVVQRTKSILEKGVKLFYIRRTDNGVLSCCAIGYFDVHESNFVVLKDTFFKESKYFFLCLDKNIVDIRKRIDFLNSFIIKGGQIVVQENVRFRTASLAASCILGERHDFRSWIDDDGCSLDTYYSYYQEEGIAEKEVRECSNHIDAQLKSIISNLVVSIKTYKEKFQRENLFRPTEFEDTYKPEHLFFIKIDGQCDASGYFVQENNRFIIKRGSSFNCKNSKQFDEKRIGKLRLNFIRENCSTVGSRMIVQLDTLCTSAGMAATYILGKASSYMSWKDFDGKSLKDVYPKSFTYKPSAAILPVDKEVSVEAEKKEITEEQQPAAETSKKVDGIQVQGNTHLFYIKKDFEEKRSCDAVGYYDTIGKKFIVMKDSYFTLDVTISYKYSTSWQSRQLFINRMCKREALGYKLKKDYIFDSPSMAATFVVGRNANGWNEWSDKDGKSLADIVEKS